MTRFTLICSLLLSVAANAQWTARSPEQLPGLAAPISALKATAISTDGRTVELKLVLFDTKKCTLRVLDNSDGATDLAAAASGCVAAVNGGYFHPDRTPLGLLVSGGRIIHPFERARLLSGILTVTNARVSLRRATAYDPNEQLQEAIQAGPFLIDARKPVAGLNATRRAARTAVLLDDKSQAALMTCDGVTLAETAEILSIADLIPHFHVQRALNLDGGSSTALWIRDAPAAWRENVNVRDYLGVKAKP